MPRLRAGASSRIPKIAFCFALPLALITSACGGSHRSNSGPTPEEQSYIPQIQITGAHVSAAQNLLGHTVTTLSANITNIGDKIVSDLDLNLTFMNHEGKPTLQQISSPINASTAPLKPYQTRAIQISFDHVPEDWNQAPPHIAVTKVKLASN